MRRLLRSLLVLLEAVASCLVDTRIRARNGSSLLILTHPSFLLLHALERKGWVCAWHCGSALELRNLFTSSFRFCGSNPMRSVILPVGRWWWLIVSFQLISILVTSAVLIGSSLLGGVWSLHSDVHRLEPYPLTHRLWKFGSNYFHQILVLGFADSGGSGKRRSSIVRVRCNPLRTLLWNLPTSADGMSCYRTFWKSGDNLKAVLECQAWKHETKESSLGCLVWVTWMMFYWSCKWTLNVNKMHDLDCTTLVAFASWAFNFFSVCQLTALVLIEAIRYLSYRWTFICLL